MTSIFFLQENHKVVTKKNAKRNPLLTPKTSGQGDNMRRSAGVEVSRIFTILHGLSRVVTTYHENSRKFTAKKHGEKS